MSRPSSKILRSLVHVVVIYLLTMSAILTAKVQASDQNSESGSIGEVDCEVSEGDKAFGIQVILDVACAAGGLGCYNDHCRYCKVIETFKSAHLESCESLGTSFPTMASLTVSTGSCLVSSGDAGVGVGGMTDPSCLYGGIGCYSDHCRFCQSKLTSQSSSFLLCSWIEGSGSGAESGFIGHLATDTPMTENLAVASNDVCSLTASYGNIAAGIDITSDTACASGGLGCINSICRFCKVVDTTQSAHLNTCPAIVTKMCITKVSDGDAAVGINIITDTSCAQGGVGCIDGVCRFCQTTSTPQSAAFVDCALISNTTSQIAATSAAPVAPTPMPTTMQGCSQVVSDGDAAVGIRIVTDSSCTSGGLGCIDQICRFCRVTTTVQSEPFIDCATIGSTTTTPALSTTAPPKSPVVTTVAPTNAPAISTAAPAKTPAPTTAAFIKTEAPKSAAPVKSPTPTTVAPAKTSTPTTAAPAKSPAPSTAASTSTPVSLPTSAPTASVCNITAAAGDVAVGINIVTDISCVSGGLGCIDSVCRFCRVTASTQSAAYVDCAVITSTTQPPTSTPILTAIPTTPTPTTKPAITPLIEFVCSRTASSGDKGVGLDIVSDVRCSEGGTGCLDEVCRFCKRFDTVQSQSYLDCSTIPSVDIGSDITFVRIPVVNAIETNTSGRVAESTGYDVDLLKESTLKSNATLKSSAKTDTSTHQSTSANTIVTLHESAAVTSEIDYACVNVSLADGQAAGGIGVVLDTINCPEGLATGCVGSGGCRYCMRFPTSVSKSLDYCAIVNNTAVPYALSGLSPSFDGEGSVLLADVESDKTHFEAMRATTAKATPLTTELPKSALTGIGQWVAVAVACVGAIVFVALTAYRQKKSGPPHPGASLRENEKISPVNEVVTRSNVNELGEIIDV